MQNKNVPSEWQSKGIFDLVKKYDKPGPRYTSYPPANFFTSEFNDTDYLGHVELSNTRQPENISFYFHVPFCPQLCHFCGCNTGLMREKPFVEKYMEAMLKEFDTVTRYIDKSRSVSQVHWGGGTPNSISLKYIASVMERITENFNFSDDCEIAMECNPAYLTFKQADELASLGFNRISLGIQDFNPEVLTIINRKPSLLKEEDLVAYLSSKGIGVNLDFVYGLPGQTPESFAVTLDRAAHISPDRIVTFSYAHVPWVKKAQHILEQFSIPDAQTKLRMFEEACLRMEKAGYIAIGLDHFAKPGDELSEAFRNHRLHRNFMGYCSRDNTGQVYAFGATAISQLWDVYSQNTKNTDQYTEVVLQKGTAVEKGYLMKGRDIICREVIQEIMCNQTADLKKIAADFFVSVPELTQMLNFTPAALETFISDGLALFDDDKLTVLPDGRLFLRNIAMLFDPMFTEKDAVYSKTV